MLQKLLWFYITGHSAICLDAPLLFESGLFKICSYSVVVAVPADVQINRLMARDNISREFAQQKIDAQMSLDSKIDRASFVIDNSGTLEETKVGVKKVFGGIQKKQGPIWCSRRLIALVASAFLVFNVFFRR